MMNNWVRKKENGLISNCTFAGMNQIYSVTRIFIVYVKIIIFLYIHIDISNNPFCPSKSSEFFYFYFYTI